MTLPRPVLIALLGLALCAAAFLATRSANDTGSAVTSVTPPTQAPSHTPARPAHAPKVHKAAPAQPKQADKPHAAAATPAKPQVADKPAAAAKPAVSPEVAKTLPVIKALGRGDVVVFFFTHPGPADDTGARIAVRALAHQKGVSVFTVGLDELETYRPVLSGAGVSQVPAIVVVHAGKKARLLQGYVDSRTLRQTVADARR
ncbi:MAG: hypothetical protein QOH76_1507 [Thermoleophilaceae bacterium]|jgi:hypothetical protein|nr:hypothetical protein [Thermoleophilaceae bacterium]